MRASEGSKETLRQHSRAAREHHDAGKSHVPGNLYPRAGPCSIGQSVWAVAPMIQRGSSAESQGRAVWPSRTWPRYPPTREEGKLEPHMTRRGVKASITRLKSSCSDGGRLAYGPSLVLDTRT